MDARGGLFRTRDRGLLSEHDRLVAVAAVRWRGGAKCGAVGRTGVSSSRPWKASGSAAGVHGLHGVRRTCSRGGEAARPHGGEGSGHVQQQAGNARYAARMKFFFQRGLGIDLPDELVIEPDRWLDPLAYGKLLHSVFERFVRELVEAERSPKYPEDMERLNAILDDLVEEYRDDYPPPTDHAFQRQVSQLQQAARVFLIEEDRYCAEGKGTPVYLESSFGLKEVGDGPLDTTEPIPIKLADGSEIRVCGRVDRIDRIGKGATDTYVVWDYKSGSAWKYDEADPFRQGRVIQPTLYIAMVAHRLRAETSSKAKVTRFGFFFPGAKERGRRIEWDNAQLAEGKKVLGNLIGVIRQGLFLPTDNKDDCNYCNYKTICGDAVAVAASSAQKLGNAKNKMLKPIRELRNHVEE